jgi:hypothetical protein
MKKRILSIITVLALCLSLLPTTAWAVTEDDDSGTSTDSVTIYGAGRDSWGTV